MMDVAYMADPALWLQDLGLIVDQDGNPVSLDAGQVEVLRSPHRRIIINCHRQWGKSTICSAICFHRALYYPRSLCLLIAPSLRQSGEDFRKVQDCLDQVTPRPLLQEETKLTLKFDNGSRIIALPGGNDGKTVRGYSRPDVILVDEAAQTSDELFHSLMPMVTRNPASKIIMASTPFGSRGIFHHLWTEGGPEWHKIKVTADQNPRLDQDLLAEIRRSMEPWRFAQEYMGEFHGNASGIFSDATIEMMFSGDVEPLWPGEGGIHAPA